MNALLSAAAHDLQANIATAKSVPCLHELASAVWRSFWKGRISEAESEALEECVSARRRALGGSRSANCGGILAQRTISMFRPRRRQASPDRAASRERRRVLGGSGALPDNLRGFFTEGQRAALTIVVGEVKAYGKCTLPVDQIAALAGVGRTTVQNAVHEARRRGLVKVTARPRVGAKNLPNVIEILSPEWMAWIKRGPKRDLYPAGRTGSNSATTTKKMSPTKSIQKKKWPSGRGTRDRPPLIISPAFGTHP